MDALIVSPREEVWKNLAADFMALNWQAAIVPDLPSALGRIKAGAPALLILDPPEESADPAALRKMLIEVLMVNASVQTAVVSGMEEAAFHDAMEGLGVLMRITDPPQADDLKNLNRAWAEVAALSA